MSPGTKMEQLQQIACSGGLSGLPRCAVVWSAFSETLS